MKVFTTFILIILSQISYISLHPSSLVIVYVSAALLLTQNRLYISTYIHTHLRTKTRLLGSPGQTWCLGVTSHLEVIKGNKKQNHFTLVEQQYKFLIWSYYTKNNRFVKEAFHHISFADSFPCFLFFVNSQKYLSIYIYF